MPYLKQKVCEGSHREAIVNGKYIGNTRRYGNGKIFINNSFCHEYKFLNYVCRKPAREGNIHRYKVKNGVNYVQKVEGSSFIEGGHILDMENLGVEIPDERTGGRNVQTEKL